MTPLSGPVYELTEGRYYAELVDGTPMIFEEGAGLASRVEWDFVIDVPARGLAHRIGQAIGIAVALLFLACVLSVLADVIAGLLA